MKTLVSYIVFSYTSNVNSSVRIIRYYFNNKTRSRSWSRLDGFSQRPQSAQRLHSVKVELITSRVSPSHSSWHDSCTGVIIDFMMLCNNTCKTTRYDQSYICQSFTQTLHKLSHSAVNKTKSNGIKSNYY